MIRNLAGISHAFRNLMMFVYVPCFGTLACTNGSGVLFGPNGITGFNEGNGPALLIQLGLGRATRRGALRVGVLDVSGELNCLTPLFIKVSVGTVTTICQTRRSRNEARLVARLNEGRGTIFNICNIFFVTTRTFNALLHHQYFNDFFFGVFIDRFVRSSFLLRDINFCSPGVNFLGVSRLLAMVVGRARPFYGGWDGGGFIGFG